SGDDAARAGGGSAAARPDRRLRRAARQPRRVPGLCRRARRGRRGARGGDRLGHAPGRDQHRERARVGRSRPRQGAADGERRELRGAGGRAGLDPFRGRGLAAGRHRPGRANPGLAAPVRPDRDGRRPVGGDPMTRLIVPAYFHPAVHPQDWTALIDHARHIRLVVLNIANGPGDRIDDTFIAPLDRLYAERVTVAGYVDTDYGRRDPTDIVREIQTFLRWYRVDGVFFD